MAQLRGLYTETDMLRPYNLLVDHKEPYDLIEKGGRAGEAHFWLMPPIKELVGGPS